MFRKLRNRLLSGVEHKLHLLNNQLETVKMLQGKQLTYRNNTRDIRQIEDAEFKVFSQWGDDGIIQYLVSRLNLPEDKCRFIEFGVENYTESNTRFLLLNNNWSGLVLDGSQANIDYIKQDPIYWKYDLTAVQKFINAENINSIFENNGFTGEIGLLHIDLDGNDYWVWKAITAADPIIAIIEYNSMFGPDRAITIPYDPEFVRTRAHSSNLYAGASLPALYHLAEQKGYSFIGCNSAGNNAYFIKSSHLDQVGMPSLSREEGYNSSKFREARNEHGELIFQPREKVIDLIKGLPVWNVINEQTEDF